jgi:site-specific DNA-cytosine methylase
MHKQIGNAVPVLLAEKVAKEIKKMIESKILKSAA